MYKKEKYSRFKKILQKKTIYGNKPVYIDTEKFFLPF